MENFITIAKNIMLEELPHDGVFVDYTMNNGYDALYMAQYMSEGNVITFATTDEEVDKAYELFESNFQDNVHIVVDSPINVEKYVQNLISGFTLDTTKETMTDDEVISTIETSLRIMKRRARGMVVLDRSKGKSVEYIKKMPRDRVQVIALAYANHDSPIIFLIEKIV